MFDQNINIEYQELEINYINYFEHEISSFNIEFRLINSKQNNSEAQFYLGLIYFNNEYY